MTIDLRLVWRVGLYGAAARAILNIAERTIIPVGIEKVITLPLGGLVALITGAFFVYRHAEQDLLPSLVGGGLAGGLATMLGLFLSYRFSLRWLGGIGGGPMVLVIAFLAGAIGGLAMRHFRRVRVA